MVEVICNGHDVLEEVLQFHLGKRQDHVAQPGTVVYLALEDCLAPGYQYNTVDHLDLVGKNNDIGDSKLISDYKRRSRTYYKNRRE